MKIQFGELFASALISRQTTKGTTTGKPCQKQKADKTPPRKALWQWLRTGKWQKSRKSEGEKWEGGLSLKCAVAFLYISPRYIRIYVYTGPESRSRYNEIITSHKKFMSPETQTAFIDCGEVLASARSPPSHAIIKLIFVKLRHKKREKEERE